MSEQQRCKSVMQLGLFEGPLIEIIENADTIKLCRPKYTLVGSLAKIRPDNLHDEHDTGSATGREEW